MPIRRPRAILVMDRGGPAVPAPAAWRGAPRMHAALDAALVAAALAVLGACSHAVRPQLAAPAPLEPPKPIVEFTPVQDPEPALLAHPHGKGGPGGKPLCQVCHVPGAAGVKKDPIALCADCHDPALMKHAFRMEAPAHAVGKLPLMPGGIVACHTCHEPHDVKARRSGLRLKYSELCLACHARHGSKEPAGVSRPHGGKPHYGGDHLP